MINENFPLNTANDLVLSGQLCIKVYIFYVHLQNKQGDNKIHEHVNIMYICYSMHHPRLDVPVSIERKRKCLMIIRNKIGS